MVKLGWLKKLARTKAKTNIIGGQMLTGYFEEPFEYAGTMATKKYRRTGKEQARDLLVPSLSAVRMAYRINNTSLFMQRSAM